MPAKVDRCPRCKATLNDSRVCKPCLQYTPGPRVVRSLALKYAPRDLVEELERVEEDFWAGKLRELKEDS